MSDGLIQITVVSVSGSGESHPMEISSSSTVKEAMEWATMYLAMSDVKPEDFVFLKDGNPIGNTQQTLLEAGVQHGDLLAVQPVNHHTVQELPDAASDGGGLDFSSLLGRSGAAAPAAAGGLNFSNLLGSLPTTQRGSAASPAPVYYLGMSLDDAMMHNRHPRSFVELLFTNDSLFKELNYHQPLLAVKLRASNGNLTEATTIWRDELTKGSIRGAMVQTERMLEEQTMNKKLKDDPDSKEAKDYFQKKENQKLIEEQYRNAMEEFPESMGKILMLYVDTVVNGHPVQAFVDSGAQSTIMTKQTAELCGIGHLIDTRFAGQAVGVGTGTILGRIHLAQMKIDKAFFPITITVMEKMSSHNDMKFLLGLDNLKRFTCSIDLEQNVLRFKLGPGEYMSTPFLHEKDLGEDKGGTRGFDAEKANQELMELRQKHADSKGDDHMEE